MHDELERTAESPAVSSARLATAARLEMLDVATAISMAERAAGSKLLGDPAENGDLGRAFAEASAIAEKGERAAIIAPAERLATMRDAMRRIGSGRVALVAHAIAGHGAEELAALTDLGWGVLCASGPEDSFDLTLIARRASEDCGVPFLVVHALGRANHPAGRASAMVGVPQDKAIQAFVGPRVKIETAGSRSVGDRAFAERVPFALGAALREYGSVSGRRHDVFDKVPLGESPLVIVGTGPIGDALFCATHELRGRGYDVGAIHLTALRPFPGPRLVKALARALAVTVLEPADEPLTHGALLARDVKSAFTDALTWVPGFPGIGRIPKLFVGAAGSTFDITDLAAVCENMLSDERGRRIFSFVDVEHALPRPTKAVASIPAHAPSDRAAEREVAVRVVLDDMASASAVLDVVGGALAAGVGLRTHGIVTSGPGGTVVDLLASRDHARGGMARRRPRLVIATEKGVTSAGAVVALGEPAGEGSAILGVIGADPSGLLPDAVRTIVRERRARVLPLAIGDGPTGPGALAAVVAGAVLAAASRAVKTPLDGGAAARAVGESVAAPDAELAGQRARRAFEAARDILAAAARGTDPDPGRPLGVA